MTPSKTTSDFVPPTQQPFGKLHIQMLSRHGPRETLVAPGPLGPALPPGDVFWPIETRTQEDQMLEIG